MKKEKKKKKKKKIYLCLYYVVLLLFLWFEGSVVWRVSIIVSFVLSSSSSSTWLAHYSHYHFVPNFFSRYIDDLSSSSHLCVCLRDIDYVLVAFSITLNLGIFLLARERSSVVFSKNFYLGERENFIIRRDGGRRQTLRSSLASIPIVFCLRYPHQQTKLYTYTH